MRNLNLIVNIALAALLLLCVSCTSNPVTEVAKSAVKAVTGTTGGPSLDVSYESEKTKGDKHEENAVKIGQTDTKQTAHTIVNNQEIPIEFLLICVIGWLLPSPYELWRGFLSLFSFRRRK